MLTDHEKASIEWQEQYRHEVAQRFKTKSKIDYIETGIKILQGLAIVVGIWATWNEFRKQNEALKEERIKENRQLAKDFSKDFHDRQLDFYAEALDATSAIATEEKTLPII